MKWIEINCPELIDKVLELFLKACFLRHQIAFF